MGLLSHISHLLCPLTVPFESSELSDRPDLPTQEYVFVIHSYPLVFLTYIVQGPGFY